MEAVRDARQEAIEPFDAPAGEAYGPNELSMLVCDPSPAHLTVKLPVAPSETEGFLRFEDGTLHAGGLGFLAPLEGLEGRGTAPDPLFTHLRAVRSLPSGQLDVEPLATLDRRSSAPTAREVREALEARLAPARAYRVRRALKGAGEESGAEARPCSPPGATHR